jgi:hypothetical protein
MIIQWNLPQQLHARRSNNSGLSRGHLDEILYPPRRLHSRHREDVPPD